MINRNSSPNSANFRRSYFYNNGFSFYIVTIFILISSSCLSTNAPPVQSNNFDHKEPDSRFEMLSVDLGNSAVLEMVKIPSGTFQMGAIDSDKCKESNETPAHNVTLSSFYMGKYEVTVDQFKQFVSETGYQTTAEKEGWAVCKGWLSFKAKKGTSWRNPGFQQEDNQPVVCVTLQDANSFCDWLTQKTGKEFSLPTEAQWEYACRAGTKGLFNLGDELADCESREALKILDQAGWFDKNSKNKTHPVGRKQQNSFGLYDMQGNVWEWCSDGYEPYTQSSVTDPVGGILSYYYNFRGGGWDTKAKHCRSSNRDHDVKEYRYSGLGFRVVTANVPPKKNQQNTPEIKLEKISVDLGDSDHIDLLEVPAGKFIMGSDVGEPNERPTHEVYIDSFYLSKFEITQKIWKDLMGNNPSKNANYNDCPVENVSWEIIQQFIQKLNLQTGQTFRLPTEAEWEYACRAGSSAIFSFGNDKRMLGEYAWYSDNASRQTHPVGQLKPNAWGFYDMQGNVSEWCQDWYDEHFYQESEMKNPLCLHGEYRVARGGSCYLADIFNRCARRSQQMEGWDFYDIGFRLACTKQTNGSDIPTMDKVLQAKTIFYPATAENNSVAVDLGDGVNIDMAYIPNGSFWLTEKTCDCKDNQEKKVKEIFIHDFYIDKYEVTQKQWTKVMGYNPSNHINCYNCPVEQVSWDEVQVFIVRLNHITGKNFRLPTEAEWRHACRERVYYFSDSATDLPMDEFAWFNANSGGRSHPVGQKKSNTYGLYDMYGNVWEWVEKSDELSFRPIQSDQPQTTSIHWYDFRKTVKGGNWFMDVNACNLSGGDQKSSGIRSDIIGFRLAHSVEKN